MADASIGPRIHGSGLLISKLPQIGRMDKGPWRAGAVELFHAGPLVTSAGIETAAQMKTTVGVGATVGVVGKRGLAHLAMFT